MKVEYAIEGFLLSKRLDFSAATVRNYEGATRRFLAYIGDCELVNVTSNDIRRYLGHLHEECGLSKRSVHSHWAILSSFWTWAEVELNVPHLIRGTIPAPSYRKRTIVPFTHDELKRLVRATSYTKAWQARNGRRVRSKRPTALRDKAVVLTLLDTGLRASELCALVVRDYDVQRGRVHVQHGKGDKERFVMVGSRARKALWRFLASRHDARPAEPLFPTRDGRALRRENLLHLVARLGEQAGVANVHPHRFRHTFAIEFLRNGGNVLMLKELMGHEKLEMIQEYVKLAERDLDDSARHSPVDNWRI